MTQVPTGTTEVKISARQARRQAIEAIIKEAASGKNLARTTMVFIEQLVAGARMEGGLFHLTDEQMETREYAVFDTIFPHGKSAAPGSAGAAVERSVLLLDEGEYALLHNSTVDDATQRCDCTTSIEVSKV